MIAIRKSLMEFSLLNFECFLLSALGDFFSRSGGGLAPFDFEKELPSFFRLSATGFLCEK